MNIPVKLARPKRLDELFEVFDRLELGESVSLTDGDDFEPSQPKQEIPAPRSGVGPWLAVTSSGSTGKPKQVWCSWPELSRAARVDASCSGWMWASPFSPVTFAGVQVALHAWKAKGSVISLSTDWPQVWKDLIESGAAVLSCTPTFLDLLLQFEVASNWRPRHITLGGEVLRPSAGARFGRRLPDVQFSVIYASAEHGVLLKSHRLDGWYEADGFSKAGVAWRVRDDVLEIAKGGEWVSTGDRVEVRGNLLHVLGRVDGIVNIGGSKICLEEVGRLAEEVAGIRRALAFVEASPIVGQVVGLKYALEPGADSITVRAHLESYLRTHLRKEAWPRRWEVDPVGLGRNSKRVRL